jgi:hypothetical protein
MCACMSRSPHVWGGEEADKGVFVAQDISDSQHVARRYAPSTRVLCLSPRRIRKTTPMEEGALRTPLCWYGIFGSTYNKYVI